MAKRVFCVCRNSRAVSRRETLVRASLHRAIEDAARRASLSSPSHPAFSFREVYSARRSTSRSRGDQVDRAKNARDSPILMYRSRW